MNHKATAVYFSPTGGSAKCATSIAKAIDADAKEIDITIYKTSVKKAAFDQSDLVVFCAPVYGGRIYRGVLERLKDFKGNKTPCVITVSYGNRHYDDALLELSDFVKERGFIPIAGAALIARHTFGEIQIDRPNEDDLLENKLFANRVFDLLNKVSEGKFSEITLPGNRPYIDGEKGGGGGTKYRPTTNDACIMCGLCAKNCPEGAIAEDNKTINNALCISCFRCIRNCPVQAKECTTEAYIKFAKEFTEKLSKRRENEYFI